MMIALKQQASPPQNPTPGQVSVMANQQSYMEVTSKGTPSAHPQHHTPYRQILNAHRGPSKFPTRREMKYEDIMRVAAPNRYKVDLTAVYFYMDLAGNLGLIRRTIIQDVLGGRSEFLLKYNPHPSPRAGIAQVICPKEGVQQLAEAFQRKGIERLPLSYDPLGLSPRSNHW